RAVVEVGRQVCAGLTYAHRELGLVTLKGAPGAVVEGTGRGDTVRIRAPGVTLAGLTVRGAGGNLTQMNAGIFIEKAAKGTVIRNNHIQAPAFGIWVDATPDVVIQDNRVEGDPAIRSQDRGNGIHLYAVSGARVSGNRVWHTRDGIYIDTSNGNTLEENFLHDLRYGIHYMYSHHNRVRGNHTRNTRTGYALMQSKYLTVTDNLSERDQNYGILMNFITHSTIADNRVLEVQRGRTPGVEQAGAIEGAEGKALFVYNSLYNTIRGNRFGPAEIGIHLTAGSEDNQITGNTFSQNRTQVKYVANRQQAWPGNYWSDYLGWDMDGDGRGDVPYEPNDRVDKLLWQYPSAKLLLNSPAVLTLRWVQREFPVLRPAGVQDPTPLMEPPL
ncbi:MAG: nitrous oxide reductase family maturation protein NosD, partial [Candidatus Competibacteraceae bacterium]|nr:nitrous oxide reductase family maturation protein NosD [Candidatus Competibacteraceae bacterium]